MKHLPCDICRCICSYMYVRDCLSLLIAIQEKLYKKDFYVKKFEKEPIINTFRIFKKGQLRTYKIHSYISNGTTYSQVSVSPICRTFICKHTGLLTPSKASQWLLYCLNSDVSGKAPIVLHNL